MKRPFLFLSFWFIIFTIAHAQQFNMQHIGVADGLCNDYIKGMAQDKKGFIWIATEVGLSKFDGYNFTNFNSQPNADKHLSDDGLNCILYEPYEDKLWIGGKFHGIDIVDFRQMSMYNVGHQDSIAHVMKITHSRDSSGLWITSYYGDLVYYDKNTKEFTHYNIEIPDNIQPTDGKESNRRCVIDDGQGHVYIAYVWHGLGILDLKTGQLTNLRHDPDNPRSLPSNNIRSLYIDSHGNLWVGTFAGLALYNPKSNDFTIFHHHHYNGKSLLANDITDIYETRDGHLWIATDGGGISILDLSTLALNSADKIEFKNLTPIGMPYGLSSPNAQCIMQDHAGNIWIGNANHGVDVIPHISPSFMQLPYFETTQFSLRHKPVWSIWYDPIDSTIWAGGENEIVAFRPQGNQYYNIDSSRNMVSNRVISIAPDGEDHLLLGLYSNGLLRFNKRTGAIQAIDCSKPFGSVNILYSDQDNNCILVGLGDELYKYSNCKVTLDPIITNAINGRKIIALTRDSQGKLWVGTEGRGIVIFNPESQEIFCLDKANADFPNNEINSLYLDSKGEMWAATRFGLVHFADTHHPEDFVILGYEQGLEDVYIRSIGEDQSGDIWITNNNHIAKYVRANDIFERYGIRDGIPLGNFVENSWCTDSNGNMYFGSLGGVCYFHPKQTGTKVPVAPVVISDLQVQNRNTVRVWFTVADYAQRNQVQYEYYLQGVSKHWTDTQGDHQITFRDLPAGKYTLKVRASLHNQPSTTTAPVSVNFKIDPPLWLTWWMKLFYALLILSILLIGLKIYRDRLRLKGHLEMERQKNIDVQMLNDERLRFFTNITHELRTPLTLILGPLEDLTSDVQLPVAYQSRVKAIHDSAQRLLTLVNQILEFRKTETQNRKLYLKPGSIQRIVMGTALHYKELNRNKKVRFVLNIDKDLPTMLFDQEIVATVLENFLSNAVKYTPEGEIRITLRECVIEDSPWAEISVADTGYGIDTKSLPHIFDRYYQAQGIHQAYGTGIGLALVKILSDIHNAKLSVQSTLGKGSIFSFAIKIELVNVETNKTSHEEATANPATDADGDTANRQQPPLVLVVEDNDDIRDYITASLSSDFRVISAANGKQGLELALKNIPDIVVTDVMMPEMDGNELCQHLKAEITTCHIPVVMLTAKDSMLDKEKGYESGADSYLTKPFTARLLTMRLNNLLTQQQRIAQHILQLNIEQIVEEPMTMTDKEKVEKGKTEEEKVQMTKLSKLDAEFLEKLRKIVEESLSNPALDMAMVCEGMNMSHSTLYRKLKALMNLSGNEYIRKMRLAYALKLFNNHEANISEVAYACGFNDPAYFRACFKREYGITPSEYLAVH